ncbi:hypothetical protein DICPUDRAFT_149357 [Dictyostelium purpureum]|uniref:TUG ubiquitin-like domain-containing protein n=1 Tax=Dictyostelium purpureum TaxID=5786 RepID=F0ZDH6_DICPU|nr:uncharacterized protein DICPUDRAFT_149357 [Dictyostelium purpureum]EGC37983.1 hypothetical protein DICPUDRAFT_149357 [Dictyostelium purpureum]|eukprot:XP_003285467.1 hypothetical protein DICPUDRAFT_149357 [Dictyostelium purpureum]
MTSSLHIIYKSGKFTVPVIASNSMLEVFKKGCQHFKLNDSSHQLMYGNTNVNLSLPYRLSGIPNLSRVTISEKRGTTISTIKIAIQMVDGKRYQASFKTSSTLWDILVYFQTNEKLSIIDQFNENNQYIEPIINILNREISTIELLQKSSLASLNVTESSLVKLTFKQTDRSKDEILPIIESYQPPSIQTTPTSSPTTATATTTTTTTTPTSSPTNTNTTSSPINKTILSPTTSETSVKSSNSTTRSTTPSESSLNSSENTTPSMDIDKSPKVNEQQPLNSATQSPTTSTTTASVVNASPKTTSSSAPEPPKIITMDPKDRELKAYLPTLVHINPKAISHNEKLTDEDFKRLVEANKRIKKEKDEFNSVLRTKSMREREEYKKIKNFQTTTIRVVLPGVSQKSLEMKFLVREKISNLVSYLNTLLVEPNDSLFLYTTPPYKVLNNNVSFLKESLFPRAKIFLGVPNGTNITFNEEVQKLFDDLSSSNTTANTTTTTTTATTETDVEMNNADENDNNNNNDTINSYENEEREREIELEREREREKARENPNQIKAPACDNTIYIFGN